MGKFYVILCKFYVFYCNLKKGERQNEALETERKGKDCCGIKKWARTESMTWEKKIPLILNILKKVTSLYLICAQLIKLTFIAWSQGTVLNTVNQKSLRNSSYLQGNEQVNNHKIWQAELDM